MSRPGLHRRDVLRWAGAVGASLSGACGGGGSDAPAAVPEDEDVARNWNELTPQNAPATFRNADRIGPIRPFVRAGTAAVPLPAHSRSLRSLSYTHDGRRSTVQEFMDRTRNGGLLVLKGGAVAFESYGLGNTATSRWTSFSVAKSLTSTLYGAAIEARALDNLDLAVHTVLPSLVGSAYDGATIRQLLRMTSGVRWLEDYASPTSDIMAMSNVVLSQRPGALLDYVATRPRASAPGTRWNYSSGETFVLGAVLSTLTGQRLSQLVTQWIWSRAGMEADGYWLLEAPDALELAAGNFSATLRDYGRLGLFVLREGQIGAQRLLPSGWRDLAGRPDTALTEPGRLLSGYGLGYGYQWWSLPNSSAFTAQGIFGQFLYVDPAEELVAVVWSAWPTPNHGAFEAETYTMLAAAADALR
jgi:CubicO group peptidase (beta-lactamase class C family)